MSAAHRPRRRLRHRLMLAFSGFALLVAVLYGFYVVLFVYLVEDQMFNGLLEQEAKVQLHHHATQGGWARPALPGMAVHETAASLPDGLAARLAEEPWRREFAGDQGRHYHLRRLEPGDAWLVAEVSQQLVVRPMRGGILQWLGGSSLGVLVIAMLLGAWLARRMTAPLSRLSDVFAEASPSHLPTGFAESLPDDEVGALARTLQGLLVRIEAFVDREREFTRDASHELRTPLAVIRSACERMQARDDIAPEVRLQAGHIDQCVRQLERTVSALLMLAREQQLNEMPERTLLLPLLERVVVDQSPLLQDRAVNVELCVPADAAAWFPPTALHIVCSNLIGNAFAHCLHGSVRINLEGGWLKIRNPASGEHILDAAPFTKGAGSSGFGLGLSIVQRLCERHGIVLRLETCNEHVECAIHLDTLLLTN
ncbi:sensor histidine kinase [Stenotrophomonas bentonitica]